PTSAPEPELWIAGGIGITPFLARLRHSTRQDINLRVTLIYCVQDQNRQLYGEEVTSLMARMPDSKLHFHHFYKEGPLSIDFIARHCPDHVTRTAFICGPVPLQELAQQHLRQGGVPAGRIVTEEFTLL